MDFLNYGIDPSKLRGSHGNVKTYCPECHARRHNKHDKSLSVNLDTGMFHCHYCGYSGCAQEKKKPEPKRSSSLSSKSPISTIKISTIKTSTQMQVRYHKQSYNLPTPRPQQPLSQPVADWLAGRGISRKTAESLGVTSGPEFMPQVGSQRETVQFNYLRNGVLVNIKYRTSDKHFKMFKGAELIPYNLDAIRGRPECIITEGEMDALSFAECGRMDVVSVPNGANSTAWLDDHLADYFDDKQVIYLAVDTDSKGVELRDELLRRFGAERCRVLDFGAGCKDANEHLMAHGKESLLACLDSAQEWNPEGVFTFGDFEPELDEIFANGLKQGKVIGIPAFDKYISFESKRICVVTGIPGSGKSEFIDFLAERLNCRYGWKFAYFSPENAPLEYHGMKLVEKMTGVRMEPGKLSQEDYDLAKWYLKQNFYFISPKDFKLDTILDRAQYLVRRHGIKCLVIDPYNRIENEQGRRNETQYVSELLDRLTLFAQQNDVMVILMAHPTKMSKSHGGEIEMPTLYDISGSAHFYNKADFGIIVHRDRINNSVKVRIAKVKFRHLGECGIVEFQYNEANGRYTHIPELPFNPIPDNTNHLHTNPFRINS